MFSLILDIDARLGAHWHPFAECSDPLVCIAHATRSHGPQLESLRNWRLSAAALANIAGVSEVIVMLDHPRGLRRDPSVPFFQRAPAWASTTCGTASSECVGWWSLRSPGVLILQLGTTRSAHRLVWPDGPGPTTGQVYINRAGHLTTEAPVPITCVEFRAPTTAELAADMLREDS